MIIALCGCMAQQEKNVEKIKKSYPQVSLLFGTHALWRFPSLLYRVLTGKKRVFDIGGEDDIAEGLPVLRAGAQRRGCPSCTAATTSAPTASCRMCAAASAAAARRRSRRSCVSWSRRVTRRSRLLGQNVNSYGKDLGMDVDFADLSAPSERGARRFLAAVYDQPPEGRKSPKLFCRDGGVR